MSYQCLGHRQLSGPGLRDTAGLSQRYPPIARYGLLGVSTWPIRCDTPSPFSERSHLGEHAKCWGRFLAERIFRGFLFLGRRIFSRIFSPDFFSSFLWEKCPEKSSRKIPGKILQKFIQQKSPTRFCRGPGPRNGGAIPPPPPPGKGYLSDTCAIPHENKANGCA